MNPQKILVINTKYRIFGGEDSNIIDELKFLEKHYQVDYLEYNNADKLTFYDLLGFIFQYNFSSNSILKSKLISFEPDIVYIHNTWFKANLGVFKLLRKKNIKVIHKIHNYRFECSRYLLSKNHLKNHMQCPACGVRKENLGIYNKYFSDSILKSLFLNFYSKKYFNILKNYSIKILVLSRFQKNYIENLGIENKKIFIYFNPISISLNNFSNYDSKSNNVVFAGRLEETKGIFEILKIWNNIDTKNLFLEVIGATDGKNNIFKQYKSEKIKFTGHLDNEQVKRKIKNSRAVITATKLFEGQPRVLLEASSFGVPSIFPKFGGMIDFFPTEYELSFNQFDYLDLQDKILMLIDSELLSQESEKIKEHLITNYSEKLLLTTFEDILIND